MPLTSVNNLAHTSPFRVSRILGAVMMLLFTSALAVANPITLWVNGQNVHTVSGPGFVGYGALGALVPTFTGPPGHRRPLFQVAILGETQPVLSNPNLLNLATFDYKATSFCLSNCQLNVDLMATGFTQPYNTFLSNLSGLILSGGPGAHYTLSAFLDPFKGSPILLETCNGSSGSIASCIQKTNYIYKGIYGLDLKLTLDANGGSGTLTDSNIAGIAPEPGSLALFGTGLVGMAAAFRKRSKNISKRNSATT